MFPRAPFLLSVGNLPVPHTFHAHGGRPSPHEHLPASGRPACSGRRRCGRPPLSGSHIPGLVLDSSYRPVGSRRARSSAGGPRASIRRRASPAGPPPPAGTRSPAPADARSQSCGFRDHASRASEARCARRRAFSAQSLEQQIGVRTAREHMPFPVVADPSVASSRDALTLPTVRVRRTHPLQADHARARGGARDEGVLSRVPPDRNAADVVAWLRSAEPAVTTSRPPLGHRGVSSR